MYIGSLSKLSGVSRKTIRLYEDIGLLPTPKRSGKYRIYEPKDIEIIRTIKCAQSLGFKLKELSGALQNESQPSIEQINALITQKRRSLQDQIEEAKKKDRLLEELQYSLTSHSIWMCDKDGDA